MASKFQNRLVGTVILVALGVIILPGLLDGQKKHYQDEFAAIPLVPRPGEDDPTDAIPPVTQPLGETPLPSASATGAGRAEAGREPGAGARAAAYGPAADQRTGAAGEQAEGQRAADAGRGEPSQGRRAGEERDAGARKPSDAAARARRQERRQRESAGRSGLCGAARCAA